MAIEFGQAVPKTAAAVPARRWLDIGPKRIDVRQRSFFTERLALLLETGTPLHSALRTLHEQTDHPALAQVIGALLADVLEGKSFSHALGKHPEVFSLTYVNLIAASENGGFMYEVLQQLHDMDERQERLRTTITSALTYPVFLMVFSVAVVVFVLVVVFPKFDDIFKSIHDDLPATTLVLMALSDVLRKYWLPMLGAGGAGVFVLAAWLRKSEGIAVLDRLKVRLPLLKDIFLQIYLVQSLRVMGLSLTHGVSVVDALNACRDIVKNVEFRRFMHQVEAQVNQGKGIAYGFAQGTFVPSLVRQMIATGEEAGNLAMVMNRIAEFYERELEKKVALLSKLAEPIMLLVMGSVVGVIVSALILPIFKISRAVH